MEPIRDGDIIRWPDPEDPCGECPRNAAGMVEREAIAFDIVGTLTVDTDYTHPENVASLRRLGVTFDTQGEDNNGR